MPSVCSFANCTHSVQRRHSEGRSKVSIRSPAGSSLGKFKSERRSSSFGLPVQAYGCPRALHGRTVHAALYLNDAALVLWVQVFQPPVERGKVGRAREAQIDLGPGFRRYYVRARSSLNGSHICGNAAPGVGETLDNSDLARKLSNCGVTLLVVDAAVCSYALDPHEIVGNSLAGSLVGPFETLRGLQHKDGTAAAGDLLRKRARGVTAGFLVADKEQNGGACLQIVRAENFEGRECHGHAVLHVKHAGPPYASLADPEGHAFERAQRPDSVEMTEQQDGLGRGLRK